MKSNKAINSLDKVLLLWYFIFMSTTHKALRVLGIQTAINGFHREDEIVNNYLQEYGVESIYDLPLKGMLREERDVLANRIKTLVFVSGGLVCRMAAVVLAVEGAQQIVTLM